MLAGDRCVNDLKRILVSAPNRDPARSQLMRQAGQSRSDDYKLGHTRRIFSGRGFIFKNVSVKEKVGLSQSFVNQFLMMNLPALCNRYWNI
jgi:hypothetical protein